jgi:UDP-glucose 4-epimerase
MIVESFSKPSEYYDFFGQNTLNRIYVMQDLKEVKSPSFFFIGATAHCPL